MPNRQQSCGRMFYRARRDAFVLISKAGLPWLEIAATRNYNTALLCCSIAWHCRLLQFSIQPDKDQKSAMSCADVTPAACSPDCL